MGKNTLSEAQLKDITDAILAGRKIAAIKVYREITGSDLKTSKQAVEDITDSLRKDHPDLKIPTMTGCASVILAGFAVFLFARIVWTTLVS